MNKIMKSRLFIFILGAVIFGSITGVAAYNMFAKDIKYTPSDSTWKKANGEDITNVEEALDELYTDHNLITISDKISQVNSTNSVTINCSELDYKYYILTTSEWTNGNYITNLSSLEIRDLSNATSLLIGKSGLERNTQTGVHKSFLLTPLNYNENISLSLTRNVDNLSIYGLK